MHFPFLFISILASTLPLFTAAHERHGSPARRHNELANRIVANSTLDKRAACTNARATFFAVGLGACGKWSDRGDFMVALNTPMYGSGYPGPHCFKSITIQANGKTTQATIMDQCPGCPYCGLDMSEGLFEFFSPLSAGVFQMDWWYNDGGDAPAPAPAPSPTHKPEPTTSWTPPAPSSTKWVDPSPWTSDTTSSHKSSTWSSPSSSSWSSPTSAPPKSYSTSTSSSTTSSSTPTPSPVVGGTYTSPQNIQGINALVVGMGEMVVQLNA
ncbi:hypothetical protein BU17DRAFT_45128 [Hysterangium stoloniferum]|nr:hypothetical protein BU17DRAFT_45128 [Hysterangium stoloniferum]